MGDTNDESVKTTNMGRAKSNKRKLWDEHKVLSSKRKPVVEPEPFSLNYLPDQILLDIFRNLSPIQLKAVGFTCHRMHRLIRDYTLWTEVDATDSKTGTKRLRWYLENCFTEHTVSVKLRGFADDLKGCLGIVHADKLDSYKQVDNIIYTNLVTFDDSDNSEDEHISCDDDENKGGVPKTDNKSHDINNSIDVDPKANDIPYVIDEGKDVNLKAGDKSHNIDEVKEVDPKTDEKPQDIDESKDVDPKSDDKPHDVDESKDYDLKADDKLNDIDESMDVDPTSNNKPDNIAENMDVDPKSDDKSDNIGEVIDVDPKADDKSDNIGEVIDVDPKADDKSDNIGEFIDVDPKADDKSDDITENKDVDPMSNNKHHDIDEIKYVEPKTDDKSDNIDESVIDPKADDKPNDIDESKDDAPKNVNPIVEEVKGPESVVARFKVVKMLRDEYLVKPKVTNQKAVTPVKQTCGVMGPCRPRPPRRCSCTERGCPGRMSKDNPWPKPVLDRMEELLALRQIEERTSCSQPTFTLTETLLRRLVVRCPNLTELTLDYCNINCKTTSLANFPPALTRLSLCGTRMYNVPKPKTILYHVHERLPQLEYLNVSKCDWLTPDTWLSMSKLLFLQSLIATDCPCMKDFIAYASLATKYGFPKLEYVDFRGSPLSDSEVSALGWVPTLRELYLSPPVHNYNNTYNLHTHFKNDPLSKVDELEAWEKVDYMKSGPSLRMCTRTKRGGSYSGELPLKKRKVDVDANGHIEDDCSRNGAVLNDASISNDICQHQPGTSKNGKVSTSQAYYNPKPGSSKDSEAPSTSKAIYEPQPGSSKDNGAPSTSKANCESQPDTSKNGEASTFKANYDPKPGSSKDTEASSTSNANHEPQPGSSKDNGAPSTSKTNCESQPATSKNGEASTSKANYDPKPSSSKDGNTPSTYKAKYDPQPGPSGNGEAPPKDNYDSRPGSPRILQNGRPVPSVSRFSETGERIGSFFDMDEDSIEEVFPANRRGAPPNAPFRPNNPDDRAFDHATDSVLDIKQILICQGGSIYQYTYNRRNQTVGRLDTGIADHLPAGYVMVPDPVPNPRGNPMIQPAGASNMRRVRMVANLGNHLQLIDRQFNRQLELFRCTSLVTDVSVRYFGRSIGDEFVHIGPRVIRQQPQQQQNAPREAVRKELSSLRILVVSGYQGITDISLKHLMSAAPYLIFLDVRDTMVTEEGVNRFLAVRPDVEVLYGHFDDRGAHRYPGFLVT